MGTKGISQLKMTMAEYSGRVWLNVNARRPSAHGPVCHPELCTELRWTGHYTNSPTHHNAIPRRPQITRRMARERPLGATHTQATLNLYEAPAVRRCSHRNRRDQTSVLRHRSWSRSTMPLYKTPVTSRWIQGKPQQPEPRTRLND